MLTLGIETSCDETAVAVVDNGKILSSEISSSVELHSPYGGVVPEIASRYHTEYIFSVAEKALKSSGKSADEIEIIAVTRGPGLPGSLLIGIAFAKAASLALGVPIVGVNHLTAHIFSCFMKKEGAIDDVEYPFAGMVASGGHTGTYFVRGIDDISTVGRTLDDAVGEAFDKVAKILDLGYPGGPHVERLASEFSGQDEINFPRALLQPPSNLDFSFSGLKTAVMYRWKDSEKNDAEKRRICYSFQRAVVDVIGKKMLRAADTLKVGAVAVGGGVVSNSALRGRLKELCSRHNIKLFLPEKRHCSDNAAMIAVLGEELYKKGFRSDLFMNAEPAEERK
jgi:N6-L-threonylcarbamoyladenine synthase